ncbi:MAG: hypothetical protein QOH68_2184 [Nocardioidaceae bacterium]|jgi:hypothetical protein|nr:hypothetical protein [Nocardioidaceae bacterium]
MNVGVDLGSSTVKVATDAGVLSMRGIVDPELSARMGTTAPVVRHVGNALSLSSPHESYVLALSRALGETPSPDDVTIVVPDWWSQRARDVVTRTLTTQYPGMVRLVGAAPAALRAFSSSRPLADPVVAVLDMGATCTSATVVVDHGAGEPQVAGVPMVLQGRGGDRLDALLLHGVLETIVAGGWSLDRSDPEVLRAGRSFRHDIRVAKEGFSTRPVVRLAPHLPGLESELRLVRAEFDDVARPVISEIVGMLTSCIAESGVDVGAVLLVGGGAPTPLLTQMISVELGLPVLLDDEPESAAARGAMRFGLDRSGREKRSRGRTSARQGVRGGRRGAARPALAARIVSLPARVPAAVMEEEPVTTPSTPAPDITVDAVAEPSTVVKTADVVVPFPPGALGHQPPVSRHAAPAGVWVRPAEQVGGTGYRGRRRADAEPANESESADEDPAMVDTAPTPHQAPR